MASQRIDSNFVHEYNQRFTQALAEKYRDTHQQNCHHWDFTFLLWHRKFLDSFWSEIGLPRTYALLTDAEDRSLYQQLTATIVGQPGSFQFTHDPNKLDSFTSNDLDQMKLDIAESMACRTFAIDLDFTGVNQSSQGFYNMSFSSQVENFHDIIHGETSRGMRNVATAGGDACFFLHHTFVDLVFETWLVDNPNAEFPVTQDMFDNSGVLRGDYADYAELRALWDARHFDETHYKHVRRISAPLVRQALVFDRIEHDHGYRRVFMAHRDWDGLGELGRFAVFTGSLATCAGCARKQYHEGRFLLRRLVPVHEIIWNINNRWYLEWNEAVEAFKSIGMSRPYVVSF